MRCLYPAEPKPCGLVPLQAMNLGVFPPMEVTHTDSMTEGQIYISSVRGNTPATSVQAHLLFLLDASFHSTCV